MIHYQLRCGASHEFDAWFRDSAAFDDQATQGLLNCPVCGIAEVGRALMTPAVPRKRRRPAATPVQPERSVETTAVASSQPPRPPAGAGVPVPVPVPMPDHVRAVLQRMRAEVERRCEYVGTDFAAEARRIHDGASPNRGIYGEADEEQAEALAEDGIEVGRLPWLPRADA